LSSIGLKSNQGAPSPCKSSSWRYPRVKDFHQYVKIELELSGDILGRMVWREAHKRL
jgi:hypothetical protein